MSENITGRTTITPEAANFGTMPGFAEINPHVYDGLLTDTYVAAEATRRGEGGHYSPSPTDVLLGSLATGLSKRLNAEVDPTEALSLANRYHAALTSLDKDKILALYEHLGDFASLLVSAYKQGLPLDLTRTQGVLNQTKLSVMTPNSKLEYINRHNRMIAGGYQPEVGQVLIDTDNEPRLVLHTIFHEYTHVITGGIAVEVPGTSFIAMSQGIKRGHTNFAKDASTKEKRVGFDEPIVDQLANIFLKAHETGVMPDFTTMTVSQFFEAESPWGDKAGYKQEAELLRSVLSGIPESEHPVQRLLAMQFEYYDPSRQAGERAPARKAFWRMVSRYADINKLDTIMSSPDSEATTRANSYVQSEAYKYNLKERGNRRARAWTNHKRDKSAQDNKHFIRTLRAGLDRTDAEFVTDNIKELHDKGLSDKEIKVHLSRIWHPDVNGGSKDNEEKLKILNDKLDARRRAHVAAGQ